jgi:hypothetical protein
MLKFRLLVTLFLPCNTNWLCFLYAHVQADMPSHSVLKKKKALKIFFLIKKNFTTLLNFKQAVCLCMSRIFLLLLKTNNPSRHAQMLYSPVFTCEMLSPVLPVWRNNHQLRHAQMLYFHPFSPVNCFYLLINCSHLCYLYFCPCCTDQHSPVVVVQHVLSSFVSCFRFLHHRQVERSHSSLTACTCGLSPYSRWY